MEYKTLKNVVTTFMVVLLLFPAISTVLNLVISGDLLNPEKNQYALFQVIVMAIYCAPAFILAIAGREYGTRAIEKDKDDLGISLYILSILASIIGTSGMIVWAFVSS